MVNGHLGKLYKLSGFNPLPEDFVFDEEAIKERLYLGQMASEISFPKFLFEEKKNLKKRFKLSLKRINKILKEKKYNAFTTPKFADKFETYLVLRQKLTTIFISKFKQDDFDECEAYSEIYEIDPIFFDLLDGIFESGFDFPEILNELEAEYKVYYVEKLKKIEQKNNAKINKEIIQNLIKNSKINEQINEQIIENQKSEIKNEKKSEKLKKIKEIEKIKKSQAEREGKEKKWYRQ